MDPNRSANIDAYRRLADGVPDALLLVGANGSIVLANARAEAMFGYAPGSLEGRPVNDLVPESSRHRHAAQCDGYFSDPKPRPMETRPRELAGRRKDGSRFPVEINLAPVQAEGTMLVAAAIRDVSARKVLEGQVQRKNEKLVEQYRRMQETNRLKSEFLANMSHELRTPLNAIIGFSELMHSGRTGPVSADQHEYLGDILASARHLLQLINDVLDLAKVEAGKMEFRPEPVQLERVVKEVCDVVRTLLARKRIELTVEIHAAVSELVIDPAKLKQVLYNYLSNAIKFTPEGGTVAIGALPVGEGHFRLEVRDNGIGIPAEDHDKLFTEFRQLDAGASKRYQGTGLGLALTRRLIEAQAGRVGVDSAPGRGSTFYAELPLRTTGAGGVPAGQRAAVRGAQATVLIVEDDPADRTQLELALTGAGYAVVSVSTAREARVQCEAHAFDAITLDLLLPDEDGWQLLAGIRAGRNARTPVVVVSIVADAPAPTAALRVSQVLPKPVSPARLLEVLGRSLQERAPS